MYNGKNYQLSIINSQLLFVGGGSLGHITPSVAVWEALQKEAESLQAHFVCSPKPLDTEYLKKLDLPYSTLDAPRFGLPFLWKFWPAVKEARRIMDEVQPDLVFSKGGHVSVPICYLAKKRKIPIILHESDAVMGRANRLVAELADTVCLGIGKSNRLRQGYGRQEVESRKSKVTGNPVREHVIQGSKEKALERTGLSGTKPILLVIGGSQGALALNEVVEKLQTELLSQFEVVHITGQGKQTGIEHNGYFQTEFAAEELADYYAVADVALSRAGSNVAAELQANRVPTILVPLRGVGHDHQQKNAEALADEPLFTVVQQKNLSRKLIPTLQQLLQKAPSFDLQPSTASSPSQKLAQIILQTLASTRNSY